VQGGRLRRPAGKLRGEAKGGKRPKSIERHEGRCRKGNIKEEKRKKKRNPFQTRREETLLDIRGLKRGG